MRKFFALLALVLCVVSCQTEPEGFDTTVGGEKEVNITVSLPEATRANSALGAFDNVDFTKYDVRFQCEVHYGEVKKVLDPQFSDNGKNATFPVRLIPGRYYTFVVWADLVNEDTTDDLHYNTAAGLAAITLNGEWKAMDETRDAYTCSEVRKFEGTGISLTLTRPFAKLRVKTTDMAELMGVVPTTATVEYTTPIYAKFNAVEGDVVATETTTKTHTYTIANYDDNSETTKILFTDYFFATAQQEAIKFDMTVNDKAGDPIGDTKHFNTAIPVQRNFLTTIAGNILTTGDNITVVIEDEFDGYYDYTIPSEVSELVNVINSAVDGVETIIPVNEDIVLPEALTIPAGKNIVLDFAANTTLTGALVVEDGAELTINNGIIKNEDKTVSGITTNGNLTLNNVEIESARHAVRVESGEVIIYGGTFEVKPVSNSTLHALNVGDDGKSATVIIKGGTFRGPKGTMADSGSAVNVRNGSTVIIEGGNFSGGKNKTLSAGADATLIVKGGFFDQDPSAFVADEYTTINMNITRSATKEYVYAVMKGEEVNDHYEILIEDTAALEFFAEVVEYDYTFAGDVVTLEGDIDLTGVTTDGDSFGPIGRYCSGQGVNKPFKGHFDGNNHTIKGIYQSGWDFGYEWGTTGYLGLFGYVKDATIENLTIEGMESVVEGGTLAAIAGRADGECTFKNITVKDTNLGSYNNRCGGIVGWTGGYYKDEAETEVACYFTFENINICEDVVLGGLWGSFDTSIGGIMGQLNSAGSASFKNVTVSCRIDAYNDCTASYDYYLYRMCGMLIGQLTKTTTIDGSTYPDVAAYNMEFDNVTVNYGEWMNYHYCEPTPGLNGGRGMRVEPGFTYDGLPADFDHTQCVDNHYNCIPFDQLFGGVQTACKGVKAWDGVTVNYPDEYTCELCGEKHNVK